MVDFATLSDERRSRSKIFPLSLWIKVPCVGKFEGLARSKLLEISQTIFLFNFKTLLMHNLRKGSDYGDHQIIDSETKGQIPLCELALQH